MRLRQEQVHEAAAEPGGAFDQLQIFTAKNDGAQSSEIIAEFANGLAIEGQFAFPRGPINFDFVIDARCDGRADEISLLAVTNHLRASNAAKGAKGGNQINGFQYVGLALGVVAKKQMESRGKISVQPGIIAKAAQPEMSQMHDTSIQNSGADARRIQNLVKLTEAFDFGRSGPGYQQSVASSNGKTEVAVRVVEFDGNEDIGKLLFRATSFGVADVFEGFGAFQILVPIRAVKEGFAR
jgi:hypothetical protein